MKDIIPLKELKENVNTSIDALVNKAIDEINKNLLYAAKHSLSRTIQITYENNSQIVRNILKTKLKEAGYEVYHPREYDCRGEEWTVISKLIISFELV